MKWNSKALLLLLVFVLLPVPGVPQEKTLFREEFHNLDQWRSVIFPKIKEHTEYAIEEQAHESALRTESHASASPIVYRHPFNVYDYPKLRWKWKVMNVYEKGNARTKAGDDYPLRIYVLFQFDPEKASFFDMIKYGLAKVIYGEYPPHSALNYIWANRDDESGIITSPYASDSRMVVLQKGKKNLDRWIVEQRNILDDYREAFGSDPPAVATLGIMNDSDNTKETSVSYVGFIEVYR